MNITAIFTQYRRKQIAELKPWQPGDDMSGVSVSAEDAKAGSPKFGDMIARNPKNHADQWLVAAAYFADNFEPLAALPHLSQGAVRVKPLEWEDAIHGGWVALGAAGLYHVHVGFNDEKPFWFFASPFDHEPNEFASPEDAKAAAQADYERRIMSSLASHEPAPEPAKDGPEVVERLRKWCSETINQWSDEYEPRENWERQVSGAMREWDKATTEIISNYEALRAENERLRAENEEWSRRYGALYEDAEKRTARNAELVKALEPFANAKITYLDAPDGREVKAKHVHGLVYGDFRRARAALGGQNNED